MEKQLYNDLRVFRNRLRDQYEKAGYIEGGSILKQIKEIDKEKKNLEFFKTELIKYKND